MNFDDFDNEEFSKIIKGEEFFLKRKFRKKKFCRISCPIIMISNTKPRNDFKDLLYVVESNESNF